MMSVMLSNLSNMAVILGFESPRQCLTHTQKKSLLQIDSVGPNCQHVD